MTIENNYIYDTTGTIKRLMSEIVKTNECCVNIKQNAQYTKLTENYTFHLTEKEINSLTVNKLKDKIGIKWKEAEVLDVYDKEWGTYDNESYIYTLNRKLMDIGEFGEYVVYHSNTDHPDHFTVKFTEGPLDALYLKPLYNPFNNWIYMENVMNKLELEDKVIENFEISTKNITIIKIPEYEMAEINTVDRYYDDPGCGIYDISVNIIPKLI